MRKDARALIRNYRADRRRHAGQSLVVAVIVLFLLMFLGGVFIALVARNLRSAQRATAVSSSGGYAEAGLRYLDEQLMTSPDGADWRPAPDYPDPANVPAGDPDAYWLKQGYQRINFGGALPQGGNARAGGRALVKVEYAPTAGDPTSKYLKLISIGRAGIIDTQDPTTYANSERAGLRRELVAYKAIGILDYVRSVWNKPNKPIDASFGAPFPVLDRDAPREIVSTYNGPMRVQGNLLFYGVNQFNLTQGRNDAIEVTGKILLNGVPSDTTSASATAPTRVLVSSPDAGGGIADQPVLPSDSPAFNSLGGLVRDGLGESANGTGMRVVGRIEPPVIDAPTGPAGLTRYRMLTRGSLPMSSEFADIAGIGVGSAGVFGWGEGMYIPNRLDVQAESSKLENASSLRGEWLQRPEFVAGRQGTTSWRGDFYYEPPAVSIEFAPDYMLLGSSKQHASRPLFRNPNGGGRLRDVTQIVRYAEDVPAVFSDTEWEGKRFRGYPYKTSGKNGDFVIFCEGNVRVSGTIGGTNGTDTYERHITLVSNGTIYIDGPLLRDNQNGATNSSIALLARDYIAVNTTQFQNSLRTGQGNPFAATGETDQQEFVTTLASSGGYQDFNFSVQNLATANPFIFFRHWGSGPAPGSGTSSSPDPESKTMISLAANSAANLYDFGGGSTSYSVPLGAAANQVFQGGWSGLQTGPGTFNLLTVRYDTSVSDYPYLLGRVAVAPLEVRIEAHMYAQEGSFFVIPGFWFNPDPNDTYANYAAQGQRAAPLRTDPIFPFHREPMDIKLTIYGSIAENLPAQIGDQGAWLEKWGWVPTRYGSSDTSTTYGGQGLSYEFNPQAILPYNASGQPVRTDRYGNVLPIVPKLPVAQGLLYQGAPTTDLP